MWDDLHEAGADGACIFAFPEDMYRTVDSPESRIQANEYVLKVAETAKDVYPFYFVWNDYLLPENLDEYQGIKWHRHPDEPRYDYEQPKCHEILERITELNLPVLIEEEYDNTVLFIQRNPELNVIIPHMGRANGGTEKMEIFFDNPKIYFDTAVAPLEAIEYILARVGPERIILGSDVSGTRLPFFNFPKVEVDKVQQLSIDEADLQRILATNLEELLSQVKN